MGKHSFADKCVPKCNLGTRGRLRLHPPPYGGGYECVEISRIAVEAAVQGLYPSG